MQNINVIEINIFSYHPNGLEYHSASAKFTNQRGPPQTIGMKKKPQHYPQPPPPTPHTQKSNIWLVSIRRWVICLKVICSKNLLDTKILIAQHCSSRCQKMKLLEKKPKKSFRADASFRPKWPTAWIATAQQKNCKMSTAWIKKNWKSGTCTAVWLKKVEKSVNMYGSSVKKQSKLG